MGKFDFETVLDRNDEYGILRYNCPIEGVEADPNFDIIPMWVADMNFKTAPCIQEAMIKRIEGQDLGYFEPGDSYFDSIISWHEKRKGVKDLKKEYINYQNSVLGGVSSAVQCLTCPGECILINSPTYTGFTHVFDEIGRTLIHSPLFRDEDGIWRMNYEDMEEKLKKHNIHLSVFCSPHNPTGRVWEKWEIEKAMEVFSRNDCFVISDEIWSDLIMPGYRHIPSQSVNEEAKNRTIAFYAPTKTFSIAAMVGSYSIIYNKYLRDRVVKQANMSHYNIPNVLSVNSLIGAYSKEGHEWADAVIEVINSNISYAYDFITSNFKGVQLMKSQGTYVIYMDC